MSNTDLGSKLQEAIISKQNDINSLVWIDRGGNTTRLMDMTQAELKRCYKHADQMLNNTDIFKPGRRLVRKNINAC